MTAFVSIRPEFQNHIPARGRKLPLVARDDFDCVDFKTISPQGDGNRVFLSRSLRAEIHFKTISPQGDGNHFGEDAFIRLDGNFKTISPQGDGNVANNFYVTGTVVRTISKPYPRKGTETRNNSAFGENAEHYFKTISPQGDGNLRPRLLRCQLDLFQNHIPARGRKLCTSYHGLL